MELQKLTLKDNRIYLDGVEIKNVKDFTLKSPTMAESELNVTVYVSVDNVAEMDTNKSPKIAEEKTIYFQDEIVTMKKALGIAIERGDLEKITYLSTAIANLTKAGTDIELQISC